MEVTASSKPAQLPRISTLKWGRIECEGVPTVFKDIVLRPGAPPSPWDWRKTGMSHVPGVRVVDLEAELFSGSQEGGLQAVVLSRGMQMVLEVTPEAVESLKRRGKRGSRYLCLVRV